MDFEDDYEDEPMTSVRANKFSGNQLVIENMDDVERKRQKRRKKRRKRMERLGKLAVCVCVIGVIVAVVLTIVLTEAAIVVTSPATPTVAPTEMPVIPTLKPTMKHPTPTVPSPSSQAPILLEPTVPATAEPTPPLTNQVVLNPNQDTYVFVDGKDSAKTFGSLETFLVQTGFRTNDDIPSTIAYLTFDTKRIPAFDELPAEGKKATLKLFRVPLEISEQDREPAPIQVSRLPSSTDIMLESVNGDNFDPTRDKIFGPIVEVPTDAVEVTFDITDLVFNQPLEDNQLFLMLDTNQEQVKGDTFFSRESDTPPELIFDGLTN